VIIPQPGLLNTAEQILALAEELKGKDLISFDTEFIRENTFFPIVEIIQVATDEKSWIVDARAFKKAFRAGPRGGYDLGIQPLLEIFRDRKILKILHAAQGDQECLFTSFGVVAAPTLDTAIAASLLGYGDNVGLGKLLSAVLNVNIKKGHARTNWSVRPLPEQLVEYAHADVEHLTTLGRRLIEQLDKSDRRPWALELSAKWEDESLYDPAPEAIAQKLARGGRVDKKGYGALVELVKWREERVKQLNLPRKWVADDTVLLDLAHVRPKDMEHLGAFRGLNKGELKNSGTLILKAIERAMSLNQQEAVAPPKYDKPEMPTPDEGQALELLKCYVGILADKHGVATRHLLSSALLLKILRGKFSQPEELVSSQILGAESAKLIGAELLAFVQGKRALSVQGTRIEIKEL
jgi:ribonuclease D